VEGVLSKDGQGFCIMSGIKQRRSVYLKEDQYFEYPCKVNSHFKLIVRKTCIMASVRSSHSPVLPLIMMFEPPWTMSGSWSIRSAFVHTIIMGTPPKLWLKVPSRKGRTVLLTAEFVEVTGGLAAGSEAGSV
jgi:hypothetical protein